jgi:hypothetical protein
LKDTQKPQVLGLTSLGLHDTSLPQAPNTTS